MIYSENLKKSANTVCDQMLRNDSYVGRHRRQSFRLNAIKAHDGATTLLHSILTLSTRWKWVAEL